MESGAPLNAGGFRSSFINTYIDATRSSLLPKGAIVPSRGKSILGIVPMIFVAFFVTTIIIVSLASPEKHGGPPLVKDAKPLFIGEGILFGILFIIGGWSEFSLLQTIEAIPTSKIESAAEGLNEITGRFVPEKDSELIGPLTNQHCIYYGVELQQYIHAGRNSYWETIATNSAGIPSLLTDGTGYLAVDIPNANINFARSSKCILDSRQSFVSFNHPLRQKLSDYINSTKGQLDFPSIGVTLSSLSTSSSDLQLVETTILTTMDYFVMGRIGSSADTFNRKPVKLMVFDSATKMLSIRKESKGALELRDKLLSFASFGTGIVLLVAGAYFIL